jgi:hypothetical protein
MLGTINWNPNRRELRNFGVTILVALALLGAFLAWKQHTPRPFWIFTVVGAAVLTAALFAPPVGMLLYRAWMGIAWAMGKVMTPVFLGIVYFLVITPIALLMRLRGRDALALRKTQAKSYWREIRHKTEPRSYERPF